jgi:uncharacterized protein (TIGR02265 family)
MTSSVARRVKGTLLIARLKYLGTHGPEKVEAVLAGLSHEDQRQLRTMVLPSTWYALDLLRRLEERMATVLRHQTRSALFLDIGAAAAAANLTGKGLQRVYVRERDPHFLLRHAPSIYASYFSEGHRTYEATGEQSAVVRTTKRFEEAHPEECLITIGWLKRAIEISGAEGVDVVEKRCGLRGAPHCEFECRWSVRQAKAATA